MERRRAVVVCLGAAVLSLGLAQQVLAGEEQQAEPPETSSILITVTVGEEGAGRSASEESYRVLARDDGTPAVLDTAWRVPVPTQSFKTMTKNGKVVPATSFTYHKVGLDANFRANILKPGQVWLRGKLNVDTLTPAHATKHAEPGRRIDGSIDQQFDVVLRDGTPQRIAVVPVPEGGSLYIQLQAEILE